MSVSSPELKSKVIATVKPKVIAALRASQYDNGAELMAVAARVLERKRLTADEWNNLVIECHRELGTGEVERANALNRLRSYEKVGTELAAIFASLGIPACQRCKDLAQEMDELGIEGVRANWNRLLGTLKDREKQYGWAVRFKAMANAVRTGLAFKIDWGDPLPGILEEAVERAEQKAQERAKSEGLI